MNKIRLSFGPSVFLALLVVHHARANASEFPAIRPGVWELSAVRTLPSGSSQRWTQKIRRCEDPTLLFRGYWGLAKLDKAGCRYEARKTAQDRYQITSQCRMRDGNTAVSDATVRIIESTGFEMDVSVRETGRHYSAKETGRHIAGCAN